MCVCVCVCVCTIFKVFIEFVTILLLFYVFFGHQASGILDPQTEPTFPALEGEILTTELPGKSFAEFFKKEIK